jgi:glycerate kinase
MELKETLTAQQASVAIAEGLKRGSGDVEVEILPWADGGPGSLYLLGQGELRYATVKDPLGRSVRACFGLLDGGATAVVEMAQASGLFRLSSEERNPSVTSTFGTGQLIRKALEAGCREILVCVGGSATNDGGAGALRALGLRLWNAKNELLREGGAALRDLDRVDWEEGAPRLGEAKLSALVDVEAPLLGPSGAARSFAPQKGASPEQVEVLEAALSRFASVMSSASGKQLENTPGAGAGGGLAFGLLSGCGARCQPAFEVFCERTQLERRIQRCDVLLTAEGRLDPQTLLGKGPHRLAQLAQRLGKPCVLFAGSALPLGDASVLWSEVRVLSARAELPTIAQATERLLESAREWAAAL